MGSLHLHQLHLVVLDPEVQGALKPNVADSVLISLSGLHCEERVVSAVGLAGSAVDEDAVGPAQRATAIQEFLEDTVALGVPVTDKNGVVILGVCVRDRDEQTAVDAEATEATSSSVHADAWVVEVAADLILDLEVIGLVFAREDGAHGSGSSVLPRVFPLLDAVPMEEEGLIQIIEDVDNDVVVAGGVDVGPRKLAIDENDLLGNSQGRNGAVRHIPREEQVRIFSLYKECP